MSLLSRLIGRRAPSGPEAPDRATVDGWVREGYDLAMQGRLDEALERFQRALEHDPDCPEALYYLGSVASNEGRHVEAVHLFQRAVDARPNDAAFWFVLAGQVFNLGRHAEAICAFQGGLALHPQSIDMAGSMWMAMLLDDHVEEARLAVEQARDRKLDSPQIDVDLAAIYRDHGRIEESIAHYRKVLARAPDDAVSYSNLLFMLNYDERYDARALLAEHQQYAARFARAYIAPPPDRTWPRKLRVGYVSGDFRRHVVAFFIEPVLQHHDKERFEVVCYYNHRADDSYTERLRGLVDEWVECENMTEAELADRIREDRIDILVDLAGHTAYNRAQVFAMKPAPVQVTYLGYPGTTGLRAIDYRVTDARADPPGVADGQSVERLVRLPDCFHCFRPRKDSPNVGPLPAQANGYITFGCFNNFSKLTPSFLDAAAAVLKAVPNSKLLLKGKALAVQYVADRVRAQFARAGVDPERLKLSGWKKTLEGHLDAYNAVDIAIDSFPYNGTTTTCEALWMGVPVVTLVGDRHAARVGLSLLHATGLQEFVTTSVDGYVKACADLASDLPRLAELRRTLRERVRRSPLTDERRFTANLERAYLDMWQTVLKGEAAARTLDESAVAQLAAEARALRAAGKNAEAAAAYEQVLLAQPDHEEALAAMWDISFETGNPGSCIDWLNKAILAREDRAVSHYMLGCSLQAQGKVQDAIRSFSRAIQLDPDYAKAHNNLGCMLEAAGNLEGAHNEYLAASNLDPRLAVAFYNRGNALRRAGDYAGAVECMRQAVAIEPNHGDWQCNLGDMLYQRLLLDEAIAAYRKAIEVEADFARAWSGLGLALLATGQPAEAEASFRKALQIEPRFAEAYSNLLLALHYLRAEERETVFQEHLAWAERFTRGFGAQAARTDEERRAKGRIKVGYISGDFQGHPAARFIEPVLAAHDRSRFHVFCYSNVPHPDETTRRFQSLCEEWRDISALTDSQVAERMRFDKLDILVDLSGHTEGGRPLLLARKPAPVQVGWIGYPDTVGSSAVDYRFTDAIADPAGDADRFHSEKLVRLPGGFLCYQPPADCPDVAPVPSAQGKGVTFGSFNNLAKVMPSMVPVWARLLKALPDSRLALKAYGLSAESARKALLEQFARHGVGAERLALLPPEPTVAGHLARYGEIDVALDAFPYNGTTTTCEALWMGVPVVTRAGASHVSRVSASLLERAGLADLVARTEDEYVEKALALARDAERRKALRTGLRKRLRASPLMDAAAFVRGVESAYAEMWDRYAKEEDRSMRLHIGGRQKKPGWKILNVQPGPDVDFIGDCVDLSQFADGTVDEIYASHVLEHLSHSDRLPRALKEFHRVLKPGGRVRISVPDFEAVCRLFLDPTQTREDREFIMQIAFGGQMDPYDFHHVGLTFEFLDRYLRRAGFGAVERSGDFGEFHDESRQKFNGLPVSVNVIATK
jgi:predicted O-linked N-acetylglucosamine transferase (SPINDLY family)/predicted SAM-dependent methyltransferase